MFGLKKLQGEYDELLKKCTELESEVAERDRLRQEVRDLKDDLAGLKSKKKIEEENIKHMVKMKEEKMELDFQKRVLEMERGSAETIAKIKDQNQEEIKGMLVSEKTTIKDMYSEILERLPNISAKMKL
ncbi:MAG: hypothetical protein JKX91_06390 [Rhizobiaceae bacterium]|nr:hypothetical protein [Rhizobiaceae bacterium]